MGTADTGVGGGLSCGTGTTAGRQGMKESTDLAGGERFRRHGLRDGVEGDGGRGAGS